MSKYEELLRDLDENAEVDRRRGFMHDSEMWARAAAAIRESQRAGYIVAMRLLQSSEVLDDKARAAWDHFLTKANIDAAVKDDWQNAMDRF